MNNVWWIKSNSCDPIARILADRHYNRQKIGSRRFVPPGRCLVLRTIKGDAVWATSWPFAEYVKHRWAGAWINSIFRNESEILASSLITEAVAITRGHYKDIPCQGFITFIDKTKVRPTKVHGKDTWGLTYLKAGFKYVGHHIYDPTCEECIKIKWPCGLTMGGLIVLQLCPMEFPDPIYFTKISNP